MVRMPCRRKAPVSSSRTYAETVPDGTRLGIVSMASPRMSSMVCSPVSAWESRSSAAEVSAASRSAWKSFALLDARPPRARPAPPAAGGPPRRTSRTRGSTARSRRSTSSRPASGPPAWIRAMSSVPGITTEKSTSRASGVRRLAGRGDPARDALAHLGGRGRRSSPRRTRWRVAAERDRHQRRPVGLQQVHAAVVVVDDRAELGRDGGADLLDLVQAVELGGEAVQHVRAERRSGSDPSGRPRSLVHRLDHSVSSSRCAVCSIVSPPVSRFVI